METSQIITGLAILNINWAKRKSYLSNFLPFIANVIIETKPEVVSSTELKNGILEIYKIDIPINTITSLLRKAEKEKYITKSESAYIPNYEVLNKLNYRRIRRDVNRQHNAIIKKLIDYAEKNFNITLKEELAEQSFLRLLHRYDSQLLSCSVLGSSIPYIESGIDPKINKLLHLFIKDIYQNDPEGSKYLDTIIKGHMLSIALFMPNIGEISMKFRDTTVYLDTALVLRLFGYEGDAAQEPIKELLKLLFRLGASVKCFASTRYEIYNVVNACKYDIASPQSVTYATPVFQYFVDNGYKSTDIDIELSLLDKNLKRLGISVADKPEYNERYPIDELKLKEYIDDKIGYREESSKALTHDTECLSAIYRLRKGQGYTRIENCKAIFVTSNNRLCKAGVDIFIEEDWLDKNSVPVVITDSVLTNISWLKQPISAPNLPQKIIIAECYAAMEPGDKIWSQYLEQIEHLKKGKIIDEDEYYLLRSDQEARYMLTEASISEEVITEGTAKEIIRKIKEKIKYQASIELAGEKGKRQEAERQLQVLKQRNKQQKGIFDVNILRISNRISRIIKGIISVVSILALCLGLIFSIIGSLSLLWIIIIILLIGFSVYVYYTGDTIKNIMNRFESYLSEKIQVLLIKFLSSPKE